MTRLEALISLNMVPEMGTIRLGKLLNYFNNPENVLRASQDKLMAVAGIGQEISVKIHSLKKENLDREFKLAKKYGLKILSIYDKDYPENLKEIPDPPIVLYIKGGLEAEDKFGIAIVGSRRASFYGLSSAEKFAADLADKGFTIVSGMARGIDTYAHKGALKQGGRTIAVMGSGFNHIYPEENQELAQEIAESGAIISEFPIDTLPLKQNFPRRNRVISGLSLGVLVTEAARNSGALITADFALEQGREVFALPGKVDSNTSFGTNGLIKQGAKLVSCVDDILEEFNIINIQENLSDIDTGELHASAFAKASADSPARRTDSRGCDNLRPSALGDNSESESIDEELLVYNLISHEPVLLDELAEKTNMDISGISDILLRLQMKKLVRQLPGKQIIRRAE